MGFVRSAAAATTVVIACLLVGGAAGLAADASSSGDSLVDAARTSGRSAGLRELRLSAFQGSDFELRLWHGFGLSGIDGLILRHTRGQWAAYVLTSRGGAHCCETRDVRAMADWGRVWRHVETLRLTDLPERPTRDERMLVGDGYSYVLEWRDSKRYLVLVYDNPSVFKTAEDLRMMAGVTALLRAAGIRVPDEQK